MFKKILIPVDGSEHSQEAVRVGIEFAKQLQAQIVFTYAQAAFVTEADGQKILAPSQKLAEQAGIVHQTHFIDGDRQDIGDAITDESSRSNCQMIIMGTHGRDGIARLLLGSIAEQVSRQANVPVMLVRPSSTQTPQFKRILVAVDGSPLSLQALNTANQLAATLGANLEIIHVIPSVNSIYGYTDMAYAPMLDVTQIEKDLENGSQAIIKAALASLETNPIKVTHVRAESIPAKLLSVSQAVLLVISEHKSDLIIMGTHGHIGLERLLLGSVAEAVSHHAKIPILLIRADSNKPVAPLLTNGLQDALEQGLLDAPEQR